MYFKDNIVGVITSGGYGFRVKKSLAFAYVQADLAKAGIELSVKILGSFRKAIVLNEMAYDPKNARLCL